MADGPSLARIVRQGANVTRCAAELDKKPDRTVMTQSAATFSHAVTARQYIDLYEKMLARPLIKENTISP